MAKGKGMSPVAQAPKAPNKAQVVAPQQGNALSPGLPAPAMVQVDRLPRSILGKATDYLKGGGQ